MPLKAVLSAEEWNQLRHTVEYVEKQQTVSEDILLVNIPGIGEGTPGEITVSCEEKIVYYKDNIPPKPSCNIKVNENDTLQMRCKRLEYKGFISPDD